MSFLDEVVSSRRREVADRARSTPLSVLRDKAQSRPPSRDFAAALRHAETAPAVIAEFKRASPSAGAIASEDVCDAAQAYERGGAAAMSVLTEPRWFGGSLADIAAARASCSLPVLRKDFIVEDYQVWEAAAAGADALLLIVAALADERLVELRALAERLDMHVLVEVHDETEARRAIAAGARIIGINNRDLRTLIVDPRTAERVRPMLPRACISVAESGYADPEGLARCAAAGFDAVLVGESLMRSTDPAAALRALRGVRV
jgi:indole-3-glycerol phosphate synthase